MCASLSASRTFAAHVIVQFTLRLLEEELSPLPEHTASRTLCGAFIFVCRQLYNTCQGLQVLQPYGLHLAIAAAWRKVRKTNTIILLHHLYFVTASSQQTLLLIVNKRQQPDIFSFLMQLSFHLKPRGQKLTCARCCGFRTPRAPSEFARYVLNINMKAPRTACKAMGCLLKVMSCLPGLAHNKQSSA